MSKYVLCLSLFAMALTGCRGPFSRPFQVCTDSLVTLHVPPVQDGGPLSATPVAAGGSAKIALIDVDGLLLNMEMTGFYSLGENPVSLFREKLDFVASDPSICGVVLRINSPGGGVTASDIMWRDLQAFKAKTQLPVVACLMDVGAGGAYYLATAADQIVAHPTTITGGMGVILNLYNLQDLMLQFNVIGTPIKAGRNIDLGGPMRPMEPAQREILQQIADHFHARFQDVVRQARPRHDPRRNEDFDGRIFTAQQALALQLIDAVGYLDDAVAMARQLGGCPTAAVVMLRRPNDQARTPYAITPNAPLQNALFPMNVPGLDRSQMPHFLYLWQPEPMLPKAGGR